MRRLTVLYDARCALCRRACEWLEGEPKFVPLEFVVAGSTAALERFPRLSRESTLERLTVVADERCVYRGHSAWLMCLWALEGYREWALRHLSLVEAAFLLATVRHAIASALVAFTTYPVFGADVAVHRVSPAGSLGAVGIDVAILEAKENRCPIARLANTSKGARHAVVAESFGTRGVRVTGLAH